MLLHDAIDQVLLRSERAMSSRELADEINLRGWYRRRDGAPLPASQVMARVRRAPHRERYTVDSEYRISRVESSPPNRAPFAPGPHGWLNWVAEQFGFPQRETVHPDSVVIEPSWEEFVLYSDANIDGTWLELGPYDLVFLEPPQATSLGVARRAMLLRSWDHLPDDPPSGPYELEDDVEAYFGGDIGDELAALLGLALARRVRSGGRVRQGLLALGGERPRPIRLGLASEGTHRPPVLEPPIGEPMIAWLADPVTIDDAVELLSTYPKLDGRDAIALIRAARQYVDGLWLADTDPRLSWIKLFSALEVAANRFDDGRQESPLAQLRRHRRGMAKALKDVPHDVAEAIAREVSRLFNVERKLRRFVKEFDPGPPPLRPSEGPARFVWEELDEAIATLYDHRSRDLHDGIAFPPPLCEPPDKLISDRASERFYFLGMSTKGGQWTAENLPMQLHVFAYLVGGVLRNWWRALAESAQS